MNPPKGMAQAAIPAVPSDSSFWRDTSLKNGTNLEQVHQFLKTSNVITPTSSTLRNFPEKQRF